MWGQVYSQQQSDGEQSAAQGTSEQPYVIATAATPVNHNSTANQYATVPPGWTTAVDTTDGRMYYLERTTGRFSWTHPNANASNSNSINTQTAGPGRILNPFHPRSWNPFGRNRQSSSENQQFPTDPLGNPMDTPLNAKNRPDTNQCYAFASCLLCPPIGLIAIIHSLLCDRAWNQGRYSDAVVHAREAPKYAGFACFVGAIFWIWFIFFREASKVNWFDGWDWNFGN